MSDAAITAIAALVTGVLVALWQVGGRAALERRRIKQELEIASVLPEGPERLGLEEQARDRSALYVHRRTSVGPSATARTRLVAATLLAVPLFALMWFAGGVAEAASDSYFWVDLLYYMSIGVFVVWAGLLGYWISLGIRLWLRRNLRRDVEEARAAIDPNE